MNGDGEDNGFSSTTEVTESTEMLRPRLVLSEVEGRQRRRPRFGRCHDAGPARKSSNLPLVVGKANLYKERYQQLEQILGEGAKMYIHCSAGIHRTGMLVFGLLLLLGYGDTEAKRILRDLRPETFEQVGQDRLQWARQFALSERGAPADTDKRRR